MKRVPWLSFLFLVLLVVCSAMVLAQATPAFAGTLEREPATVGQALAPHPFQPLAPSAPHVRADAQGQAVAAPADVTPDEVLQLIAQAVESKNWGLLACALVLGLVYGLRRFLEPGVPWLSSDVGGVVLSLVTAAALSLTATLAAGKPITFAVLLGALAAAAGASGLWTWGKKLFAPKPAAALSTGALAEAMYNGYGDKRGWTVASGAPMPIWNQQSQEFRDGWEAAAVAAQRKLADGKPAANP